jgi:hypothetical protein
MQNSGKSKAYVQELVSLIAKPADCIQWETSIQLVHISAFVACLGNLNEESKLNIINFMFFYYSLYVDAPMM